MYDAWTIPAMQLHDHFLMDDLKDYGFPQVLNACRIYLQVTTLTEIMDNTGEELLPQVLTTPRNGIPKGLANASTMKLKWPNINLLTPDCWHLWNKYHSHGLYRIDSWRTTPTTAGQLDATIWHLAILALASTWSNPPCISTAANFSHTLSTAHYPATNVHEIFAYNPNYSTVWWFPPSRHVTPQWVTYISLWYSWALLPWLHSYQSITQPFSNNYAHCSARGNIHYLDHCTKLVPPTCYTSH